MARKTARLVDQLQRAKWKRSPLTDADGQCEFHYQPEGWGKAYRFLALRYEKAPESKESEQPEQYQLFDTPEYTYRVFVTNMDRSLDSLVQFYNQRAGAENLIKEANNDAGLTAHPSNRWMMNANWFQIAMLAYNLNCWLQLFNREEDAKVAEMKHTTLATARLRFLFAAARIWRHAGRVGVSYSPIKRNAIKRKIFPIGLNAAVTKESGQSARVIHMSEQDVAQLYQISQIAQRIAIHHDQTFLQPHGCR